MIKTRFGETLDKEPPSLLPLTPAPARSRTLHRIVTITELGAYKKLSGTLAPAELSHIRARVRTGEPGVIAALFNAGSADDSSAAAAGVRTNGQGYSWACIKTTWWEKGGPPQGYIPGHGRTVMARPGQGGKALMLEVGLAALRCANLRAVVSRPASRLANIRMCGLLSRTRTIARHITLWRNGSTRGQMWRGQTTQGHMALGAVSSSRRRVWNALLSELSDGSVLTLAHRLVVWLRMMWTADRIRLCFCQ